MSAGRAMPWSGEAERLLAALLEMVPVTMRPLAESTARDEIELAAQERGGDIGPADVIRGWIRTTPPDQRDGLVEVIDSLGHDPELYSDDLASVEGWSEEDPD